MPEMLFSDRGDDILVLVLGFWSIVERIWLYLYDRIDIFSNNLHPENGHSLSLCALSAKRKSIEEKTKEV